MIKFMILFTMIISPHSFASSKEKIPDNMFALHVAYWSGCVRSKVIDKGQSKGTHTKECTKLSKNKKFGFIDFVKVKEIIEESRYLFFKGCIDGNISTSEEKISEKCHILTKKYHKDMEDILFQEIK